MSAAHRLRTSVPSFIENPGESIWATQFFAESDVFEGPPAGERPPAKQSAEHRCPYTEGRFPATQSKERRMVTEPPVITLHDGRERIKVRFRMLRRLRANHDNEGASAPNSKSIDIAIAFVDQILEPFPLCIATLDDDGSAVIEFEERSRGFFADLTFHADGMIECYRKQSGVPSELFEGNLKSPEARHFLKQFIDVAF